MRFLISTLLFLTTISVKSQELVYEKNNYDPRIIDTYADGSLKVFYNSGNDFKIDSISPQGSIYNLSTTHIQNNWMSGYNYIKGKGFITVNRAYDIANCEICMFIIVRTHDLNGNLIDSSRFASPLEADLNGNYLPIIYNDSIILDGFSFEDGDVDISYYQLFLDNELNLVGEDEIGNCVQFEYYQNYMIQESWCSDDGPIKVYTYDTNFALISQRELADTSDGKGYISISSKTIDSNIFYVDTKRDYGNGNHYILTINGQKQRWLNFDSATEDYKNFKVEDLVKIDSLIYFMGPELFWITEDLSKFGMITDFPSIENQTFRGAQIIKSKTNPNYLYIKIRTSVPGQFRYHFFKVSLENFSPPPLSTSLVKKDNRIKVYPNPVKDHLNYETSKKIETIEVTDLDGKLIKSYSPNGSNTIDVSTFRKGFYIFRFLNTNNSESIKVIIQ